VLQPKPCFHGGVLLLIDKLELLLALARSVTSDALLNLAA
jgi:hypothetical protein